MVTKVVCRESSLVDDVDHLSVLERVFANRGVSLEEEMDRSLKNLHRFTLFKDIDKSAAIIADAIYNNKKIVVVGDFDVDGAVSTALMIRVLKDFGCDRANLSYIVPHRFKYGYGLTVELVDKIQDLEPELLITVDNGIASVDGVDKVKKTMPNCQVIITDHHLAPSVLPNADAIVNPNQPGCGFPSKNLAGVGVAFYVLVAVRRLLIDSGWFDDLGIKPTQMSKYLDLVALGTISDIVPLDRNNRILVDNGLSIIRKRKSCSGINALLALGRRDQSQIIASDLSYNLAPKINAAGRLDDMDWGVKCLLTDDPVQADLVSEKLNALNHERREIEKDMQESVEVDLINYDDGNVPHTICLYDETWHQGLLGILAARIKEKHHRPCIVFAKSSDGELKGSARSISKLHMRDTLHEINMLHPGIVKRFGGHAMAAGLSISESDFETFSKSF